MLRRIQQVTPTDWGSLLSILHTRVVYLAEAVCTELPGKSARVPLGTAGAEHHAGSLLASQQIRALLAAEPERSLL